MKSNLVVSAERYYASALGRRESRTTLRYPNAEARFACSEENAKVLPCRMDEGRKRIIGIMAAILTSQHMHTADDLFGTPQGSPRTDKLIAARLQWAERIMEQIDSQCANK